MTLARFPLERRTLLGLRRLARKQYTPESFELTAPWHVGSTEFNLPEHRGLMARIWQAVHERTDEPVTVNLRWYEGLELSLVLVDELSRCLLIEGLFEPREFNFLDQYLRPGMCFIDAGANIGLYSIFASKKVCDGGRVLAFEPSLREFRRLKHHVTINHLTNVDCLRMALGDHDGRVNLKVASAPHTGHNTLGAFAYDATRLERKERVPLRTLDSVLQERGVGRADVMKLDVEGAELALLQGAEETLAQARPLILTELSDRTLLGQSADSAQLQAFLSNMTTRFLSLAT